MISGFQNNMLSKIYLSIMAVLFLLGMHYFQYNFGGSGINLPFNTTSWIFISLLLAISFWKIAQTKEVHYSRFSLYFIFVAILLCIPLLYPNNEVAEQSIPRLVGLFAGAFIFLGLQQFSFKKKHLHILLYLILVGVLIEALWGFMQYYLVGIWPIISSSVIGFYPNQMRPHGIFQQPNIMANFMATGLAIAFYLLQKNSWHRHFWWARTLIYATPLLASLLLVLNLSRTGFLASTIALLLLIPLALKKKKKSSFTWLALLAFGVLIAISSMTISQKIGRNIDSMAQPGLRMPTYLHSLEMIKQKPLLGWGYGGFEADFLSSSKQANSDYQSRNFGPMDHPHNELLYWAVEGGLVPVLGLALAAWFIFSLLWKAGRTEGLAVLALLFPILLHTQTEYPFYHSIILWLVFVILLFLADWQVNTTKKINWPPVLLIRVLAIILPIFTLWFMVTTLITCKQLGKFEAGGFKDIDRLYSVTNIMPFSSRFNWDLLSWELRRGIKERDKQAVLAFGEWAEQVVKHTPRPEIYKNWIVSLRVLGKKKQADIIQKEAHRLYPDYPVFIHKKANSNKINTTH